MYRGTARSVRWFFVLNGLDLIDLLDPDAVHGGSMGLFGAAPGARRVHSIIAATIARVNAMLGDPLLDLLSQTPAASPRSTVRHLQPLA